MIIFFQIIMTESKLNWTLSDLKYKGTYWGNFKNAPLNIIQNRAVMKQEYQLKCHVMHKTKPKHLQNYISRLCKFKLNEPYGGI